MHFTFIITVPRDVQTLYTILCWSEINYRLHESQICWQWSI